MLWGVPRLATHGWVLAVAMLVLAFAPLGFHQPVNDVRALSESPAGSIRSSLGEASGAHDATQERQLPPVSTYQVKAGDNIDSVAANAGITVDTLVQVNQLPAPLLLSAGERLLIPPVDGIMLAVDSSDTLGVIASRYGIDADMLREVNGLHASSKLPKKLFIPTKTDDKLQLSASADPQGKRQHVIRFRWPTTGIITQPFSDFHPGIDIANDVGTPEVAADAGVVTWAGWGDYGIYVEIDHGNGFHTVYGHMAEVRVTKGQVVTKGELIGLMGATGRATGPHLHFEIRFNGAPQNPLDLLT